MNEWSDEYDSKSEIHSFIVRIWLEEIEPVPEQTTWHGRIVYLSNGEQNYFRDLMEIPRIIQTRLGLKNTR